MLSLKESFFQGRERLADSHVEMQIQLQRLEALPDPDDETKDDINRLKDELASLALVYESLALVFALQYKLMDAKDLVILEHEPITMQMRDHAPQNPLRPLLKW